MKQREIKFRAFQKADPKRKGNKTHIQKDRIVYDIQDGCECGCSDFSGWLKNKENIIMQYTGLKDKRGKPVYEGDVVEGKHGSETKRWVVKWDEEIAGWCPPLPILQVEIIGNIYENPKLKHTN